MVAEGALEVSQHPGMSVVNSTFTAYVELKPVKEVSCSVLFLHTYLWIPTITISDALGR